MSVVKFIIDGVECIAEKGEYLLQAARQNGIYIPSLCHLEGYKPRGSCRICNVKVNGRLMTACTTPVADGMDIENDTPELRDIRTAILEILFVEGNHFCPACERSGNCELQAQIYRHQIMAPRFPFQFPDRDVDASHPNILKDYNRCILCKRCIRAIKDENGKSFFAFKKRSHKVEISMDPTMKENLTEELAQRAMEVCPVGALLRKEKGYDTPIGKRKYDKQPIGSEIETAK
ncbi:MAG: NADP oxidoreductase [Gemmatimonadetes bacterium]|nr:MAG: NADP oxidoreductase [Gemmatimonadota bacterium]